LLQQCNINPLYAPQCSGYQTATTQCSVSPLYASYCPGYSTAVTSCNANALNHSYCPGYSSALTACSTNPLTNTLCSGYTTTTNVCNNNPLTYTYCPSYTTTLAACSINSQSNTLCPGYNPNIAKQSSGSSVAVAIPEPTVSPTGEVKQPVVADKTVSDVITTTATTANPAQAATSTVPLVQAPQQTETKTATAPVVQEQKKEEKKEERKEAAATSTASSSSSTTVASASTSSGTKDQPKTVRQDLQERREAAAKAQAIEDGKNLAENMGKAVDMEQQKLVQNVVVQAMAFVPGFDAYSKKVLADRPFYPSTEIYRGRENVDNRALSRRLFGRTDQLHDAMVNQQYR